MFVGFVNLNANKLNALYLLKHLHITNKGTIFVV